MFSLPSLQKLLVLVAIIMAVWFGFKLIGSWDRERKERAKLARQRDGKSARGNSAAARDDAIEDMVKCPSCGDYVPQRRPTACGKAACPY